MQTATLSTKTMPDLLKILSLQAICDGRGESNPFRSQTYADVAYSAAKTTGTIFFSAPLYRPNLHYQVLAKPSSAKSAIEAMGKWIISNHRSVGMSI